MVAAGSGGSVRFALYILQAVVILALFARLHRAQTKTAEAVRRAEEASKSKSIFLANMSHEIRNPLSSLLGFAELLKKTDLSIKDRLRYASIVERTGIDLLAIVNDILDLSKVEADKFELDAISFSPKEFLSEIYSVLSLRCLAKEIELEFTETGFVPGFVCADPLRVRQILMNLLGNAIKFTKSGKVRLEYFASENSSEGILYFRIIDSGIGLAEEQRAHLFEQFSQGDSTIGRRFAGTGLGLALSRRLANLMGGDVRLVESQEGRGSIFAASIGYRVAIDSSKPSVCLVEGKPTTFFGRNVLVADDSADNRFLFECLLAKLGLNVTLAENGEDALERVRSQNFDLVLMDMQMPVLDGYKATASLRETHPNLPVIALTAHAMKEDREKCLEAGCRDYLTKPVQQGRLVEVLHQNLSL